MGQQKLTGPVAGLAVRFDRSTIQQGRPPFPEPVDDMSQPRIFVAGATGYTGRATVQRCIELGAVTVAHVRPDSGRLDAWRARFGRLGAQVTEAAWQPAAMERALATFRPTYVFALLGTTRRRARAAARSGAAESYRSVDLGLTCLLIDAAVRAAAVTGVRPRLVYLSAIGARADSGNSYLRVRGEVEERLAGCGLPWLAVRPSFITGADREEGRPAERITAAAVNALLAGLAPFGGRGLRRRYRSATAEELARGMVCVSLRETGAGRAVGMEVLRDCVDAAGRT